MLKSEPDYPSPEDVNASVDTGWGVYSLPLVWDRKTDVWSSYYVYLMHGNPKVNVSSYMMPEEARKLAAKLIAIADEVDNKNK